MERKSIKEFEEFPYREGLRSVNHKKGKKGYTRKREKKWIGREKIKGLRHSWQESEFSR